MRFDLANWHATGSQPLTEDRDNSNEIRLR
jgi:hypothetical protein